MFELSQEVYENIPRWEVQLSDGRKVYQGFDAAQSWKDLRKFLIENPSLKITALYAAFRDNYIIVKENADGYFFRCSILATYNWSKLSFILGYITDGILTVEKWELPEMTFLGKENREFDLDDESVILNGRTCEVS